MPFPNPATQFKPGCQPGPGRPKGTSLTTKLRDMLEKNELDGKPIANDRQVADLLVEVIVNAALKGDFRFVDLVINRVDGKLRDEVESNGSDGATQLVRDYLLGKNRPADSAS
jgi:hypothetical protein